MRRVRRRRISWSAVPAARAVSSAGNYRKPLTPAELSLHGEYASCGPSQCRFAVRAALHSPGVVADDSIMDSTGLVDTTVLSRLSVTVAEPVDGQRVLEPSRRTRQRRIAFASAICHR